MLLVWRLPWREVALDMITHKCSSSHTTMQDQWNLPGVFKDETIATRTFQCPGCREFLLMGAATCRFCNLPIDAETARQLLIENQQVINAVANANTYKLSIWPAMLYLTWRLWHLEIESYSIMPGTIEIIAIGYGLFWLHRYRSLVTKDADYPVAVNAVKRTLIIWISVAFLPFAFSALLSFL